MSAKWNLDKSLWMPRTKGAEHQRQHFLFFRHSHARAIPFELIGCCTSLTLSLLDNDFDFLYMYGSFLGIWLQVHSFTQNTRFLQYATYRSPWYNRMGKSTTSQCIEKLGTKISSWPIQTCCMKAIQCPGPCGEVLRRGRGTTLETLKSAQEIFLVQRIILWATLIPEQELFKKFYAVPLFQVIYFYSKYVASPLSYTGLLKADLAKVRLKCSVDFGQQINEKKSVPKCLFSLKIYVLIIGCPTTWISTHRLHRNFKRVAMWQTGEQVVPNNVFKTKFSPNQLPIKIKM